MRLVHATLNCDVLRISDQTNNMLDTKFSPTVTVTVMGYGTVWSGRYVSTFQRNLLPPIIFIGVMIEAAAQNS